MDSKFKSQFKKGSLDMVLLSIISQKETYGYEILTRFNETGGKVFGNIREGTVYPILYRLEEAGLIRHRLAPAMANGGMKKFYSITPEGKEVLNELTDFWIMYTQCVNSFLLGRGDKEDGLK